MCMYMCTLTSSLGPAFITARVVYRVSGYIHKGAHITAAACGMLILFILECAAEECAANFNGVTFCSPQTLQQWSAGDPDDGELRRSTTFLTAIEIEIRNVRTER